MTIEANAVKTINWTGYSGAQYGYSIYPIDTSFKELAGNYIFAKETKPHTWLPVYIGQTNSLKNRLSNHEKESCAIKNGATHIHVHTTESEAKRLSEEKDLVFKWKPSCNEQLV